MWNKRSLPAQHQLCDTHAQRQPYSKQAGDADNHLQAEPDERVDRLL